MTLYLPQAKLLANLDFGDSDEEEDDGIHNRGLTLKDPFNPDGVAAAALGGPDAQGLWDASPSSIIPVEPPSWCVGGRAVRSNNCL